MDTVKDLFRPVGAPSPEKKGEVRHCIQILPFSFEEGVRRPDEVPLVVAALA
jgi:hypothetical protein